MIQVKNISTGEVKQVFSCKFENGYIINSKGKLFGERFIEAWKEVLTDVSTDGVQRFTLNEDWEAVTRAKRTTKKDSTKHSEATEVKTKAPKARKQKKVEETKKVEGKKYEHPAFQELKYLVQHDRELGRSPWLFGPAGSGKSTLCEAVAKDLGLPFYSVSSLQQKYELEGYTDAAGEYIETTFFKAAKEGGIFLFDEASTTAPEVQIAFNSMLANLWYNFPKHGMITAHKDFHVIAADNTAGRGADSTYSARFQLDASTLDRYITLKIGYTREHDMYMSKGDVELVDFLCGVRIAIDETQTTYLASPRTAKTLKAFHADKDCIFNEQRQLELALCSGWQAQDVRTICTATAQHVSADNKYMRLFQKIAKEVK